MTRWFKHAAIVSACLGLGAPVVQAQPGYPATVGAARQVGPLHYVPDQSAAANLAPGPLNPLVAPAGPPPTLNLPADHSNAFPDEGFPPESRAYGSLGIISLARSPLTNLRIASRDGNRDPVGRLPQALGLSDISPRFHDGLKGSVGYLFANEAVEMLGFYQPDYTEFRDTAGRDQRDRMFLNFARSNFIPAGFEGNDGLWRQADYVKVSYTGAVGSAELNYRRWNSGLSGVDWLMGLRYFHAQERVAIHVDDDLFNVDPDGNSNRLFRATYAAMTRTNHVGIQAGFEWSNPIPCDPLSFIWITTTGKMSAGFNFVERSWRLTRGDGLSAFDIHRNNVLFGSVGELGLYADSHILERLRFRVGYQYLLAINFPDAASQVTFGLGQQGTTGTDNGCIQWHGYVMELQFLF